MQNYHLYTFTFMYVYLLFIYEKSDPSTLPSGTPREIFWLFWPLALYYLVMNQTTTIQFLWANNFLVLRLRFCDQWCQRLSQSWGKHYKQGWAKKWSLVSGNQCGENFLYHSPTRIVECRHSTRNFSGQGRFCEIRTLQ